MSERTGNERPGVTPDRGAHFVDRVETLSVPNQTERLERRLYRAGIALPVIGLVVIGMGWWGASGTKYAYQEIPYVISGGIFGLALVFVGAALFARYSVARLLRFWLARLVAEQQVQGDRAVHATEQVVAALHAQTVALDRLGDRLDRVLDAQSRRGDPEDS